MQALGQIKSIEQRGGDKRFVIEAEGLDLGGAGLGDSIAVNGVCLTAVDLQPGSFAADVSRETLALTTRSAPSGRPSS